MKHRVSIELSALLVLLSASACERTAEGIKQDALEAASEANRSAQQAKQSLDDQMTEFKAETTAKPDELSVAVAKLAAQTSAGVADSKQKLQSETDGTKAKPGELQVQRGAGLERARTETGSRV